MSDHTKINNNNQVFQNTPMTERQSSTNTTNNNKSIDTNTNNNSFIINNITIPQTQNQYINIPLPNLPQQQPLIFPIPPPPPAAFQIQPKLNPSAPTFTPNMPMPFSTIPTPQVQGFNNINTQFIQQKISESLAKLQILSIQLNTLQLINQQNPTIETLNQYQNIYQQYNNQFTNTLILQQYIQNLTINNSLPTPTPIAPIAPANTNVPITPIKKQLETIEEGENENEDEIGESMTVKLMTSINGETTDTNHTINGTINDTKSSDKIGENECEEESKSNTELEDIKRQIRGILNKITGENFDKLSFEIANILKISDIAASELSLKNNNNNIELYKLQKSQFKALIKLILKCILSKAIAEQIYSNQYGRLCYSLYCCVENNEFKKKLFRQQLLSICHSIFTKTRLNGEINKFIGIITMIGELYHYGLISWNVINSGIFEQLLPPINGYDIQAVCKLLKVAGNDFDRNHKRDINNIIYKLGKYSEKYDFRIKCFVKDITEMRGNHWQKVVIQKRQINNNKSVPYYRKKNYNNGWRGNGNGNGNGRNNFNGYRNGGYNNRKKQRNIRPTVEFVKDVTLKDRSHYGPNKILTKTWAMRNSGEMSWGDNVELVYFKGDKTLSLDDRYPVINASPGQEVQISATIKTPLNPGRYCTYFRLQKNGKFFGPRVWVDIIVSIPNHNTNTPSSSINNSITNNEANHNKILSCQ